MPNNLAVAAAGWTLGGSILTFAFPMILCIIVGVALWVLFTRPDAIAWRAGVSPRRSVSSSLDVRDPQSSMGRSGDGEADAGAGDQ